MPPKRPSTRGARSSTATSTGNTAQQESGATDAPSITDVNGEANSSKPAMKRLDSLQQSSLGSAPSSRGRGGPSRPMARPRGIGRRSQKDRAELEKADIDRRAAEAANHLKDTAWQRRRDAARARGSMRGRMRGGYAGENERRKDTSGPATGIFSLGEVSKRAGQGSYSGTGRSGGGAGGGGGAGSKNAHSSSGSGPSSSGIKQERDTHMSGVYIKQEDGGYVSSDGEEDGARKVNVDNIIDLTGEDGAGSSTFLAPVRIQRIEHKERHLVAISDAASTTDATIAKESSNAASTSTDRRRPKQRGKDVEITGESHRDKYKGTYTDSEDEGEAIKAEPMDEDGMPRVPETLQSPPTSPESRRRAKERIKTGAEASKSPKPAFQTVEEQIEWEVHERDLRILRTELGQMTLPADATSSTNETDMAIEDPRSDKVYLFQLPAVLPGLTPLVPKAEDDDVNMEDVPDINDPAHPQDDKAEKKAIIADQASILPSGLVGKLRVHASGKAYLDWGGIPMEVSMGQEANFLQDILVLDTKDAKSGIGAGAEDDIPGTAMSMGQVKGKFVVVPEWDKIFEEAA